MQEIMEINYVSPISNYKFDNFRNRYYLVITNTNKNNVNINKIVIKNPDNINNAVRAYFVGNSVKLNFDKPFIAIKLFEHDLVEDTISLLFSCNCNIDDYQINKIQLITLNAPTKVMGQLRSSPYNDETSFLNEQFYNYETFDEENKCILFVTIFKKHVSKYKIVNTSSIKFDMVKNKYIYNRYHNSVIRESAIVKIDDLCLSNTLNDYIKLVKLYNMDVNKYLTNKYLTNKNNNFKEMFKRLINFKYRNDNLRYGKENTLVCPNDGRLVGFEINESLKFNLNNKTINFTELVNKPFELINNNRKNNGFITRLIPSDYQRIYVPFSGTLKDIITNKENSELLSLKFESTYFTPKDVHEREYISVIYGHPINDSKVYPELLKTQPHVKLVYYLILVGKYEITNNKLNNMKNSKLIDKWFDKGEEIGCFDCCFGTTILMVNRPIKFADDIEYYSKLRKSQLVNKIACYIKLNDIVGELL